VVGAGSWFGDRDQRCPGKGRSVIRLDGEKSPVGNESTHVCSRPASPSEVARALERSAPSARRSGASRHPNTVVMPRNGSDESDPHGKMSNVNGVDYGRVL